MHLLVLPLQASAGKLDWDEEALNGANNVTELDVGGPCGKLHYVGKTTAVTFLPALHCTPWPRPFQWSPLDVNIQLDM